MVFSRLADFTRGLYTTYPVLDPGLAVGVLPRSREFNLRTPASLQGLPLTYLDNTASTKLLGPVEEARRRFLDHYGNIHTENHVPARVANLCFHKAHEVVLRFVGANPETHLAVFVGDGATGAINRVALNLFQSDSEDPRRDTVIFSGMEHHSNQLPWQEHALRDIPAPIDPVTGLIDMGRLEGLICENKGRLRLVAMTGTSNVTGILPDLTTIARWTHAAGGDFLVDAAQMLAHHPIDMQAMGIDFLVASAHKVYAPGGPGILVTPRAAVPRAPVCPGGGTVVTVDLDRVTYSSDPQAREEAGTPNIIGAVMLAASLMTLGAIGMERVWGHEEGLTRHLMDGLQRIAGVTVYGDTDLTRTRRAGVVSFNIGELHHAIVSRALSDYFNIATRNGCFCAQPHLKTLLRMTPEEVAVFEAAIASGDRSRNPGMVRASLGIYTSEDAVDRLLAAVTHLAENVGQIAGEYSVDREGNGRRCDGWEVDPSLYDPFPRYL